MVRGRSRRKRSPPNSPSKSLIARVRDGWATWHSSAARVKFSVRATARKYRTWCISIRTSPGRSAKQKILARFRSKVGTRQLTHILQARIKAGDKAAASLEGNVAPRPIEGDHKPVAETNQKVDVGNAPQHPGRKTRKSELAELGDSPGAADRGERTEIAIAEYRGCTSLMSRRECASNVVALLFGHRSDAGEHDSISVRDRRSVADYEDFRMTGHRQIGANFHPRGAIDFSAEPTARRRCHHACGPDNSPSRNELIAEAHAFTAAIGDRYSKAYFNTELFKRQAGLIR